MEDLLSFPSRAYNYVDGQYGTIGVIVVGLMLVVGAVAIIIWFDRRK